MGSTGVRDEPCNLAPFPEVPIRIRNMLMRYGFSNPDQVAGTPDEEILLTTRIAPGTVAIIRRYYPFTGERHADMICPCCGGRGRVKRFEARTNRRYSPGNRGRRRSLEEELAREDLALVRKEGESDESSVHGVRENEL